MLSEVDNWVIVYILPCSFNQNASLTLTVLVTTIDALRHFETG